MNQTKRNNQTQMKNPSRASEKLLSEIHKEIETSKPAGNYDYQ
jgi:hypothetical protein